MILKKRNTVITYSNICQSLNAITCMQISQTLKIESICKWKWNVWEKIKSIRYIPTKYFNFTIDLKKQYREMCCKSEEVIALSQNLKKITNIILSCVFCAPFFNLREYFLMYSQSWGSVFFLYKLFAKSWNY